MTPPDTAAEPVVPDAATLGHPTAPRGRQRIGVLLLRSSMPALLVLILLATLALQVLNWTDAVEPLGSSRAEDAATAVAFFAWSMVGYLIVARRPGNRVGLILLVAGLSGQAWVGLAYYAAYGIVVSPDSLPAAEYAAWSLAWLPTVAFGVAFTYLFLLFPDGRLPSARWRPFAAFVAAALLFTTVTWATEPGPLGGDFAQIDNPLGVAAVGRIDSGLGWMLFLVAVIGSVAGTVLRLRRSRHSQRQQLKWFTYAAAMVALALVTVTVGSSVGPPATAIAGLTFSAAIGALPLAVFLAIFKHRLYEIDLVISRTIVLGVLVVFVTGVYVALVAVVGAMVGRVGEVSLGVAVLATAIVAVVFQPIRVRAQRLANRLVYGERATPYEVLSGLARRMGDANAADNLLPHLAATLAAGTGAVRVEVWGLADRRLHRVAAWPESDKRSVSLPVPAEGSPPAVPDATEVAVVRHRGELVGALAVTLQPGQTLSPVERRLLADLAAQVGAVLDNLRLIEELKASRQRIVAAQDEERRRIERDIHDGVQQRLVSLALALRLFRDGLRSGPAELTADTLSDAEDEARTALAELRRLARGIHPAIVSEGGLAAALDSLAERSAVPTEVVGESLDGLPAQIEVTVYYLVAEALANVAKHANATAATVSIEMDGGRMCVVVDDDGVGGAVPSVGSGLTGLADRVTALDGTFEVVSPPGQGTRLRAELPCAL